MSFNMLLVNTFEYYPNPGVGLGCEHRLFASCILLALQNSKLLNSGDPAPVCSGSTNNDRAMKGSRLNSHPGAAESFSEGQIDSGST